MCGVIEEGFTLDRASAEMVDKNIGVKEDAIAVLNVGQSHTRSLCLVGCSGDRDEVCQDSRLLYAIIAICET